MNDLHIKFSLFINAVLKIIIGYQVVPICKAGKRDVILELFDDNSALILVKSKLTSLDRDSTHLETIFYRIQELLNAFYRDICPIEI